MAGDPNAADDVTQLTRLLTEIAIATNATVMLITHSPKSSRQKESSADAAEVFGSTAFVDNARCAFVVNTMRPHEASEFGVSEKDSGWYLCLTAAKVNYGRSGTKYWFQKEEVAGWDSIRLEPVNLFPQSLFRNHSALSKTLIENVKAKPGYYTARKLRDLAGTDGPLKASDAEVRRTLNRMIDEGQLISRAPTAMEREQHRLQSQVREVLDVAAGFRGS
jgi:RecA-family ATPase